jgi:ADP-ribosylglycohydrolase
MLGAIVGDVAGSYYESFPTKSLDFDFFREQSCVTDDSVLSIAVADWILHEGNLYEYFHDYVARYPDAGYTRRYLIRFRLRTLLIILRDDH